METHTIKIQAFQLGFLQRAINGIKGDRPIMLAYKLVRFLKPVDEMQKQFVERMGPYLDDTGRVKEKDEEKAQKVMEEQLEIDVPVLTIADLEGADGLTVADDSILMFLMEVGALV
jgi:hypothetical protein